jgi:hypothetical protein
MTQWIRFVERGVPDFGAVAVSIDGIGTLLNRFE